jgi:uncharacterized protein (DUF4415 family)
MPAKSKDISRRNGKELTGRRIDAMTPAQRQKIIDDVERSTPQERDAEFSAPITRTDRARLKRLARNMGRPKLGKNGTRQVSITVEADLLDRADSFARSAGMNRSELISKGLLRMLRSA